MDRTWYLVGGEDVLLLQGHAEPPKDAVPISPALAAWRLVAWAADPTNRHVLYDIGDRVASLRPSTAHPEADDLLKAILRRALLDGTLRAFSFRPTLAGGGASAPTAAPAAGPAAPKPVVNPRILPPKLVVVVAKTARNPLTHKDEPYTHPKRQAVTLSTDEAFDGTGTFTCSPPGRVKFWSAAKGGVEIELLGKDNVWKPGAPPAWARGASLEGGVTLYVEGLKASGKMDDITLKLALTDGWKTNGPDDTSTVTSVELTLDICKPRPAAGGEPPPLSQDDKVYVGRNVLVQGAANQRDRAQLVIKPVQPPKFVGNLVLTARGRTAHVEVFREEKPRAGEDALLPYTIAAADVHDGDKLWAQGATPSDDMRDAGFVLGIEGVEDEGDLVKMTAVELVLDIFHRPRTPGVAPVALGPVDKVAKGRYVLKQDAGKHNPRALLIARAVKPKKFDGVVVLEAIDPSKTDLFTDEVAASGLTASPHSIDCKTKNEDKKFWVEGTATSTAIVDAGYTLRLEGHPKTDSDRVGVTVVELEIEARVPTTPSARVTNAVPAPATHAIFKSTSGAKALADNAPTVLVRNSLDVALAVTTKPRGLTDFAWSVEDNPGPAKGPPVVTAIAPGDTATLAVDAAGGYAVHGGVGDASAIWNVVLVELVLKSSTVRCNSGNFRDWSTPGEFQVRSGTFDLAAPATCAMYTKAKVTFSAGDEASLDKYLDRVHAGFAQSLLSITTQANYADGTRERERIASTSGVPGRVLDPTTKVEDLGYPVLDSGKSLDDRATGGDTIYLSHTQSTPVTGKERTIETCDSPGVLFDARRYEIGLLTPQEQTINSFSIHDPHLPVGAVIYRAKQPMISNIGVMAFRFYLAAYSDDAKFTYVAFGSAEWTVDCSGTVAVPASGQAAPVWTRSATCGVTGSSSLTPINNGQSADKAGCEVRSPVVQDRLILDAR